MGLPIPCCGGCLPGSGLLSMRQPAGTAMVLSFMSGPRGGTWRFAGKVGVPDEDGPGENTSLCREGVCRRRRGERKRRTTCGPFFFYSSCDGYGCPSGKVILPFCCRRKRTEEAPGRRGLCFVSPPCARRKCLVGGFSEGQARGHRRFFRGGKRPLRVTRYAFSFPSCSV